MSNAYLKIADGLKMIAAGYELLAGSGEIASASKAEKSAKVKEVPTPEAKAEKAPKVEVKDVRAVMRQKIKDGKMEECQEALHSFGVEKLTDVPADKLAELLAKVEVL